jgi:hypothetical protein
MTSDHDPWNLALKQVHRVSRGASTPRIAHKRLLGYYCWRLAIAPLGLLNLTSFLLRLRLQSTRLPRKAALPSDFRPVSQRFSKTTPTTTSRWE